MSRVIMRVPRIRERGVTLVEVMTAIVIMAMISTMLLGGLTQTSRNKQRIEQETERYHLIRLAMERMVRELGSAYMSAQVNPSPQLQAVITGFVGKDRGGGDRIDFNSFSHHRLYRNAHESDQNELSYFMARNPNRDVSGYILARREQNRPDDQPGEGGDIRIVLEDVEDFQLEYLDPLSKEWQDSWDTQQALGQPNRLPAQVKITLTVAHPRQHLRDRGGSQTFVTRATIQIVHALNHASYNP
jgi:general secretion pathway protein J